MTGKPGSMKQGTAVSVTVTTESITDDHIIHFNRGAAASQEYARRFLNRPPNEVGQGAYDWLSRGLLAGIISFIERAKGKQFGFKRAFYDFHWPTVANALHDAQGAGPS